MNTSAKAILASLASLAFTMNAHAKEEPRPPATLPQAVTQSPIPSSAVVMPQGKEPAPLANSVVASSSPTPTSTRSVVIIDSVPATVEPAYPVPPGGAFYRRKRGFFSTPERVRIPVGTGKHGKTHYVDPPAFDRDGYRYEPRLQDMRYLPNTYRLPDGSNNGARELLPVLPPYRDGYFSYPR